MSGTGRSVPQAEAIRPHHAPVVPRVRIPGSEASLPIDRQIRTLLDKKTCGRVYLVGPEGSGKTTALEHLAATLEGDAPVALIDEPCENRVPPLLETHLVLSTSHSGAQSQPVTLEMAPWTDDDAIEYLLATHPGRCRGVMDCLKGLPQRAALDGLPELWRIVLDEMAADDRVRDIDAAFSRFLERELDEPRDRRAAESLCLSRIAPWGGTAADAAPCAPRVARIIRHNPIKVMLAARCIVRGLCDRSIRDEFKGSLPRELIEQTARLALCTPEAAATLEAMTRAKDESVHAMAASILHVTGAGWQPRPPHVPMLCDARLPGARWAGVELTGANLTGADLRAGDLPGANLAAAKLAHARMQAVNLQRAKLAGARFHQADLRRVNLYRACADRAEFIDADLTDAMLPEASLRRAIFRRARLDRSMLLGADLTEADLRDATITDALFANADLTGAILSELPLRLANFEAACFRQADLSTCDLEEIDAPRADFRDASLRGALLTGSVLRGCSFRGASLRDCGLADIDWEAADLRDADLRGSTFHMGSTRSGLVASDVPCEGSRTGFYTDDFHERDFKDPRDIRKANLCRADLRGANIEGVDFYLVDLRQARYTHAQHQWFLRCGAILCGQW